MSYFVILKNMKVAKANVFACNYFISAAPVMAAHLFSHAMGAKTGCRNGRIAYIHHDAMPQAESDRSAGFKTVVPQQRKAATFINKEDYAGNSMSLSLQPVFTADLEVSLVMEFDAKPDRDIIEEMLFSGRLAGGRIDSYAELVILHAESEDFESHIPERGYFLVNRSELLKTKDPIKSLIESLSEAPGVGRKNSFLTPFVAGYALTSDPRENLTGVRMLHDDTIPAHAFAEPMVGLAQFVSVRDQFSEIPFWEGGWDENSAYLLTQKTK